MDMRVLLPSWVHAHTNLGRGQVFKRPVKTKPVSIVQLYVWCVLYDMGHAIKHCAHDVEKHIDCLTFTRVLGRAYVTKVIKILI